MGTNYYLQRERDKCHHCGRSDAPLHIGKSSAGWHFGLHIDPENNINSLDDWIKLWSIPYTTIINEYDKVITPEEMLDTITNRSWPREGGPHPYVSWDEFHVKNHSEPGLNGLAAHKGYGEFKAIRTDGTYDLMTGYFR